MMKEGKPDLTWKVGKWFLIVIALAINYGIAVPRLVSSVSDIGVVLGFLLMLLPLFLFVLRYYHKISCEQRDIERHI